MLRVINEPTTAAIECELDKKGDGKRNVLIDDVVGGTLDGAILTIEDGLLEVKAKNLDMSPSFKYIWALVASLKSTELGFS